MNCPFRIEVCRHTRSNKGVLRKPNFPAKDRNSGYPRRVGRRLLGFLVVASFLLAADPALAQASPATPELIQRAEKAGQLDRSRADLFRTYAIAAPQRLPAAYRSDAPWDGTLMLLQVRRDLPRLREAERTQIQALLAAEASTASCSTDSSTQANILSTSHFHVTYNTVGGGLSAAEYGASLEEAWQTEVDSFGWAPPPVYTPNPAPGNRYHVRIDALGPGLYGYVDGIGTHAGFVGNNPATAWNDLDAYASCMVLNSDYSDFLSAPQAALDSTTAHEFNHSIQFGIGALTGTTSSSLPDDVFVEGGATWMEDEVQDAADDNYHYLWPDFGESMGDYDDPFPYPYWITFRGLTERYGTGSAGGSEQVMQQFWELSSQNATNNQAAMAAALGSRGTTLGDAFHAYAVAVKFNRACGGGYVHPYCFEEGPGYVTAAGSPPVNRSIASVGGSTTFSVEDNYALAWVALPPSSSEYDVTLTNTSGGGQLRGTAACDTGSGLVLSPFPALAASGQSRTLVAFDPIGCTSRVLVVTNQSQTAANPNNSNSRSFSVSTAAASAGMQTLSVTPTGSGGTGTVTSSPAGINCGDDCSESYALGTPVTLTATPDAESTFAGWGDDCSGTGTCTVTMSASHHVTAAFNPLVDDIAPQTTIIGGPSGQTSDSTPTFSFTSTEGGATFICQLDTGASFGCASPYTTTPALADGPHTFSVYARDTAGNADPTPATRSFTVAGGSPDTDPPETTITGGPSGTTSDNTPTFSFSSDEADSSFVCELDQGLALPCTSPHTTEALASGSHVFAVYARDSAGNVDPTAATRTFTVGQGGDVTAPAISRLRLSPTRFRAARSGAALVAAVGTRLSLTLSEAATVTFRVNRLAPGRRVGGRCVRPTALNRGAARCTRTVPLRGRIVRQLAAGSTQLRYRGRLAGRRLRPGRYVISARARDAAGNSSAVRRVSFTIVR
jgi:Divergent InlB B-repeat domain